MSVNTPSYNICSVAEGAEDGAAIPLLLVRDLVLVAGLLGVALVVDAWLGGFESVWIAAISALVGFPAGVKANAVFHEWGHFIGVRMSGGHAPTNSLSQLFPMFHFDMSTNTHRQFMAMSYGGTLTEWLFPIGLLFAVGTETIGHSALITGAFSGGILAILIEGPVMFDAIRSSGAEAWSRHMSIRGERIKRTKLLGIPIVLVLFIGLLSA